MDQAQFTVLKAVSQEHGPAPGEGLSAVSKQGPRTAHGRRAGVANSGCLFLFLTPSPFLSAGFEPWDSHKPEPCPWPLAGGFQEGALPMSYADACSFYSY